MLFDVIGDIDDWFYSISRINKNLRNSIEIQERIRILSKRLELPELTYRMWKQWHGNFKFHCVHFVKPIGQIKKFSGYVKTPSSVGSKKGNKVQPDPRTVDFINSVEFDYYLLLTVGRLSGASVELLFLP